MNKDQPVVAWRGVDLINNDPHTGHSFMGILLLGAVSSSQTAHFRHNGVL